MPWRSAAARRKARLWAKLSADNAIARLTRGSCRDAGGALRFVSEVDRREALSRPTLECRVAGSRPPHVEVLHRNVAWHSDELPPPGASAACFREAQHGPRLEHRAEEAPPLGPREVLRAPYIVPEPFSKVVVSKVSVLTFVPIPEYIVVTTGAPARAESVVVGVQASPSEPELVTVGVQTSSVGPERVAVGSQASPVEPGTFSVGVQASFEPGKATVGVQTSSFAGYLSPARLAASSSSSSALRGPSAAFRALVVESVVRLVPESLFVQSVACFWAIVCAVFPVCCDPLWRGREALMDVSSPSWPSTDAPVEASGVGIGSFPARFARCGSFVKRGSSTVFGAKERMQAREPDRIYRLWRP